MSTNEEDVPAVDVGYLLTEAFKKPQNSDRHFLSEDTDKPGDLRRKSRYRSSFNSGGGIYTDKWMNQTKAEFGTAKVLSQVDDDTFEEVTYSMQRGKYKIGIFFVPVDENFALLKKEDVSMISARLDQLKFEFDKSYGLVDIKTRETFKTDDFKKRFGISTLEEKLGMQISPGELRKFGYTLSDDAKSDPNIGIVSPSFNSLDELKRYLERALGAIADFSSDEKIIMSPIPIVSGSDLITPYMLFSFDPFSSRDEEASFTAKNIIDEVRSERMSWYNVLQADRNSICPEDPTICEDYVAYSKWPELEGCLRFYRAGTSYIYSFIFVRHPQEVAEVESSRSQFIPRYMLPIIFNKDVIHEDVFGNFFSRARTYPSSLDEILGICAVEAALDAESVKKRMQEKSFSRYPLLFKQMAFVRESKSKIYDADPEVVAIDDRAALDLGAFASDMISQISLGFKKDDRLLQKMVVDGYAKVSRVSQYWPQLMQEIDESMTSLGIPYGIKEMIKNDFGNKYGSRTLRSLLQKGSYNEAVQSAWESLQQNKRWIS